MKELVVNFNKTSDKQAFYSVLKDLKGEQVIKIKKKSKVRSAQENKYYWRGVLRYIADYTGHSTVYLHEFFKDEYIPYVKFQDDYKLTTSDMTHQELWDYIYLIRDWAMDFLGIDVPDPYSIIL